VLRSTLRQNLHAEVGVSHLLLVVFLTLLVIMDHVESSAQFFMSFFELFTLTLESALNDLSAGQQSLLKRPEGLILYRDGCLFLQFTFDG